MTCDGLSDARWRSTLFLQINSFTSFGETIATSIASNVIELLFEIIIKHPSLHTIHSERTRLIYTHLIDYSSGGEELCAYVYN